MSPRKISLAHFIANKNEGPMPCNMPTSSITTITSPFNRDSNKYATMITVLEQEYTDLSDLACYTFTCIVVILTIMFKSNKHK